MGAVHGPAAAPRAPGTAAAGAALGWGCPGPQGTARAAPGTHCRAQSSGAPLGAAAPGKAVRGAGCSWCAGWGEKRVPAEEWGVEHPQRSFSHLGVQQSRVTAWESALHCLAIWASCRTGSCGTNRVRQEWCGARKPRGSNPRCLSPSHGLIAASL